MQKIWVKLALVLMAVSTCAILLSTILSIKEMDFHFSYYLEETSNIHNGEISKLISRTYNQENGWNEESFSILHALAQTLDLQIILYDQREKLIKKFGQETHTYSNHNQVNRMIAITNQTTIIGFLEIKHNDTAASKALEEHFQTAHTSAMQWTMLSLILFVSIISVLIARRIVRPIINMRHAATAVAEGDLTVRVPNPLGEDELSGLVTSFNNLIENLAQQEDLRKRLTSDIAHELRTPLNTLLTQVEAMIDGIWAANQEHLELTRLEVIRLSRLVQDLDQVIQTEAGALPFDKEKVDVSRIANEILQSMTTSFQRKDLKLLSNLEENVWVLGDQQRLSQIFSNLLSNSLKHTPSNGEVSVSIKKNLDIVSIMIKDSGIGIPEEDLPYVFERFYRGDRSRNRERGGAGLGLTIVKGIVEAHSGKISIDSVVGLGTTITIILPQHHEKEL